VEPRTTEPKGGVVGLDLCLWEEKEDGGWRRTGLAGLAFNRLTYEWKRSGLQRSSLKKLDMEEEEEEETKKEGNDEAEEAFVVSDLRRWFLVSTTAWTLAEL
jgi:hypothetical protein